MFNKNIVKDIENQKEIDSNETYQEKCFQFWGYQHPYCFLWIFICSMFVLAITISEMNKK